MSSFEESNINQYLIDNAIEFKKNFDISKRSLIKAGGICSFFVQPQSINKFIDIIRLLRSKGMPFRVVGNLSNVIFQSGRTEKIIISTRKLNKHGYLENNKYYAETGVLLPKLAMNLSKAGYTGFSGIVGIPGTIGGAVYMNAGAYGNEISDCLSYVRCLTDQCDLIEIQKEDLLFKWRSSAFHNKLKDYIILDTVFTLLKGSSEDIMANINKAVQHRQKYQENRYPNLGSIFATKDIYGDISKHFLCYKLCYFLIRAFIKIALWNKSDNYAKIMNCFTQYYFHLKPTEKVGFSDTTFNCIVNRGNATASEIIDFIKKVQIAIDYCVQLEIEIFEN
jgi:UDP-N-acetylmuramate dehydrogenase